MKNKKRVSMGRIVGKVDNDFNISESDWIPRAAAWIIDALSQMKCLPTELKTRKVEVSGRIAIFPCQLDTSELKVYDHNGCEIKEAGVNIPVVEMLIQLLLSLKRLLLLMIVIKLELTL